MQRLEVLEDHPSAPFKMLASTARTFSAVAGSSAGRRYASSIALKYSNAAFKAAVSKSKEIGAAVETQDITSMDALLRTLRMCPHTPKFAVLTSWL